MAKQAGEYTEVSMDLQDLNDSIDCCRGSTVVLQICVDGNIVHTTGPVEWTGVEVIVWCSEHSAGMGR